MQGPEVSKLVLEALGRPPNMTRAECRPINDNTFRCNIWIHDDKLGSRVSDSFVVKTQGDKIVSPKIERKYDKPEQEKIPCG